MKGRWHIRFLDYTRESVVGTTATTVDGMLIIDHGPGKGESGFNIRAIMDYYSEVIED